ncbi:hypothetical protein D1007_24480 [Hordeum vulgare]|nr:hypothetical protein D1007_24480 [Hordeum vulgare]
MYLSCSLFLCNRETTMVMDAACSFVRVVDMDRIELSSPGSVRAEEDDASASPSRLSLDLCGGPPQPLHRQPRPCRGVDLLPVHSQPHLLLRVPQACRIVRTRSLRRFVCFTEAFFFQAESQAR